MSVNSFERRLESCAGPYHKRILSEYCVEEKNTFHTFNLKVRDLCEKKLHSKGKR